jgi:hypothetical protein
MSLDRLRQAALLAVLVGAVGSVGFVLRAGRTTPRLVLVLMVIWVLAPFAALAWANIKKRLFWLTFVITVGALVSYASVIMPPAGSPRGFMFVMVPALSWLLIVIAAAIAAFMSRTRLV